jgi:UrcA family protein
MKSVNVNQIGIRRSIGYASAALASWTILTTSAGAADLTSQGPSVTVRYGDLNIARPAGALALYKRIQAAAKTVCPEPSRGDLERMALDRECIRQAIDAAVRDVNVPLLSEMRFGKDLRLAQK